ncbi:hypothetical protein Bca52824_007574 [Brassica carinata]|uniref:Protein kinase domain-containing protein n=1 Tax=Brassica carinata TaxID=52824 RepID=A0A8X7W7B3_BRACI|nr:hypothetical protein Bca52824_007574 [Brassica carinata]
MECWRRKKEKEKERKWFLKNGSIFLQQLIADCNGVSNPIRMFSSDQISKATDHFDSKFYLHDIPEAFTWYTAVIEGRSYMIKRFTNKWHQIHPVAPYNDIVLSSRNGMAKLTGLSKAVTLPEGKTWTEEEHAFGTYGYMDPIYIATDRLTEYSDVFSFGILMLVLLTGRPPFLVGSDGVRGEPIEFGGDSNDRRPGQMKMFLNLALRCCEERNEDRPKMISVAKEIKLIETRII